MSESSASLPGRLATSHYAQLGVHPSASPLEVRRAYRELSKLYHPDTTTLPEKEATQKFQELNAAYAILSNPQRRLWYDSQIGYSRWHVVQSATDFERTDDRDPERFAYISATDRPLSAGEQFSLFILGLTFVGCLMLAIGLGLTQGNTAIQPPLP